MTHFSDWHGNFRVLPEADLYVCTGDMFPNFVKRLKTAKRFARAYDDWGIDVPYEVERQEEWADRFVAEGGFARFMPDPSVPIVCVRGNHDFIPLERMFAGCNILKEFIDNESMSFQGRVITGHRGIPYIYGGWSDETRRPELVDRMRAMPAASLYLTHYPPQGILDRVYGVPVGLEGMANHIAYSSDDHKVHCFGHIHEWGERTEKVNEGSPASARFSNAATGVNEIHAWWW